MTKHRPIRMRTTRAQPTGTSPYLLETQIQFFNTNGYLKLDHVVSSDEIAAIRTIVIGLIDGNVGHAEGNRFDMVGAEEEGSSAELPQLLSPVLYAPMLRATGFYAAAHEVALQLLGPTTHFAFDHILMKPALTGPETPWHQDDAFRDPSLTRQEISFWLPLQDVDDLNGCMRFVRGSHLGDVLPHRSPRGDVRVHALEYAGEIRAEDSISCALSVGGCTLHASRTLHGAGPNLSAAPRYVYVAVFATKAVASGSREIFPWMAEKNTGRMQRERLWLSRGGFAVRSWRRLLRIRPRHALRLIPFRHIRP